MHEPDPSYDAGSMRRRLAGLGLEAFVADPVINRRR